MMNIVKLDFDLFFPGYILLLDITNSREANYDESNDRYFTTSN